MTGPKGPSSFSRSCKSPVFPVTPITTDSALTWSNMGMDSKRTALLLATAALAFATSVSANEIYKWTDENGNVHYEDRPSGEPTEERLALSYRRTDSGAVQQRVAAHHERQAARNEAKSVAAAADSRPPCSRRASIAPTTTANASTSTTSSARKHAAKPKSKSRSSARNATRVRAIRARGRYNARTA